MFILKQGVCSSITFNNVPFDTAKYLGLHLDKILTCNKYPNLRLLLYM